LFVGFGALVSEASRRGKEHEKASGKKEECRVNVKKQGAIRDEVDSVHGLGLYGLNH
jgi:hypothetical protein